MSIYFSKLLPARSDPYNTALASAVDTQWHSESCLRLVLIRAVITPSLDNPSHKHTNSGHDSRNRATLSPFLKPSDLK